MKKTPLPTHDPQVIAIVHHAGKSWRCMIASLRGAQPAVIACKEIADDRIGQLDGWLDENKASSVLCVVPSASVICRNCPLPDASADQLDQALRLQAEAHLLGIAPPHRLAMAVLPNAAGETTRAGLVLAWPEAAAFTAPSTTRPIAFVPDVAALAALLNGQRPTSALLWMDRGDGSIALAITHAGGAVFRATREDPQSIEAWETSVGRIIAETALSVGHTGAFISSLVQDAQAKANSLRSNDAKLFLPPELLTVAASRAQGVSADQTWFGNYGIALGALLARTGQLASLTHMLDAPPVETPSKIRAAMEQLSKPRNAFAIVLAFVLLLMFGPLALSAMRLAILTIRFGDVNEQLAAANQSKYRLAMYEELKKQSAWPVTKLLADITANTPIGIDLESIRIESGKDFAVAGTAIANEENTPAQLVAIMQANLTKDQMFSDIAVNSGKLDNLGRYKFDLSAKVNRPYYHAALDEERDFAKKTYLVRLYGESAAKANTAAVVGESDQGDRTLATNTSRTPPRVEATNSTRFDDDAQPSESRSAERSSRSSSPPPSSVGSGDQIGALPGAGDELTANPHPVPPPLDPELVKTMSKAELKDALAKVARARMGRDLDKDVANRLKSEQEMIMEYLRKASN